MTLTSRCAFVLTRVSTSAQAATLLQADFNATNPWPGFAAYRTASAGMAKAAALIMPGGMLDMVGSSSQTGGVQARLYAHV